MFPGFSDAKNRFLLALSDPNFLQTSQLSLLVLHPKFFKESSKPQLMMLVMLVGGRL